jgi:hypothetical protein
VELLQVRNARIALDLWEGEKEKEKEKGKGRGGGGERGRRAHERAIII